MLQLSEQATHGGRVFLLIWGLGALAMGSLFASKKGSSWMRELIVSGLEGKPEYQARAKHFGGMRLTAAAMAGAGLIAIAAAAVLLTRG